MREREGGRERERGREGEREREREGGREGEWTFLSAGERRLRPGEAEVMPPPSTKAAHTHTHTQCIHTAAGTVFIKAKPTFSNGVLIHVSVCVCVCAWVKK